MLPTVLVLFVTTTSAFAAPSASPSQDSIQNDPNIRLEGPLLELIDGSDNIIYQTQSDQSDCDQALAASQISVVLGELAYNDPGDAFSASQVVNQFVANQNGDRSYLSILAKNTDAIATLAKTQAHN